LALLFAITVASGLLTYVGIDAYLNSGRSVYGDTKITTGYQWKETSCSDLWREIVAPSGPPALKDESLALCRLAKDNRLPPLALRGIIEKERSVTVGNGPRAVVLAPSLALELLGKCRAALTMELPKLQSVYGRYRVKVAGLWFFFVVVAGALASYYYARRFTPVLFDLAKDRVNKIMFGQNKYSDAFDGFLGKKK
jgi:hypothetical protein